MKKHRALLGVLFNAKLCKFIGKSAHFLVEFA